MSHRNAHARDNVRTSRLAMTQRVAATVPSRYETVVAIGARERDAFGSRQPRFAAVACMDPTSAAAFRLGTVGKAGAEADGGLATLPGPPRLSFEWRTGESVGTRGYTAMASQAERFPAGGAGLTGHGRRMKAPGPGMYDAYGTGPQALGRRWGDEARKERGRLGVRRPVAPSRRVPAVTDDGGDTSMHPAPSMPRHATPSDDGDARAHTTMMAPVGGDRRGASTSGRLARGFAARGGGSATGQVTGTKAPPRGFLAGAPRLKPDTRAAQEQADAAAAEAAMLERSACRRPMPGPAVPSPARSRRHDGHVLGAWMRVRPRKGGGGSRGAGVRSSTADRGGAASAFRSTTTRSRGRAEGKGPEEAVLPARGATAPGRRRTERAAGSGRGRSAVSRPAAPQPHPREESKTAVGAAHARPGTMGTSQRPDVTGLSASRATAPGPGAYSPVVPPGRGRPGASSAFRSSSSRLAGMTSGADGPRQGAGPGLVERSAEPPEWAAVERARRRMGIRAGPGTGGAEPAGPGSYGRPSGGIGRPAVGRNPNRGWV